MFDEYKIEEFILKKGEGHQKILDVGCGDGKLLIEMAKKNKFARLWCMDLYVEYARNNIKRKGYSSRIKCIEAKAENIPLESRFFDLIYSLESLHEFDDPIKALKETRRLLNPRGEVIIVDWKHGEKTGAWWERYCKKEELIEFMKKAGYDIDNIKIEESGRFNIISYSGKQS